jgi:hypothetical protein
MLNNNEEDSSDGYWFDNETECFGVIKAVTLMIFFGNQACVIP